MPKDKSASHEKIILAAMEEFTEKGFRDASIRAIAKKAGITSGGLYRHFKDKEDMFNSLVEPAEKKLEQWMNSHVEQGYAALYSGDLTGMWDSNETEMVTEVMYPYRKEFKLIFCCSQGTKYENFLEKIIIYSQESMKEAFEGFKKQGFTVVELSDNELHMMMSAYINALIQPIMHDYSEEDTKHYIKTIETFFMPGWHKVVGC